MVLLSCSRIDIEPFNQASAQSALPKAPSKDEALAVSAAIARMRRSSTEEDDSSLALSWAAEREPSMLLPEGPPSDAFDGLLNQWLMSAVQSGSDLTLSHTPGLLSPMI